MKGESIFFIVVHSGQNRMHEQNSRGLMGTSAVFLTKKSDRKIWAMLLIGLVFTELCRESNAPIFFLSYFVSILKE